MKTLIEKLKAFRLYFVRRSYSLRWKLHIWNIKLFHKDEWIIYPNGRMYNKQQLNDAWNNLKIDSGNVEHP